MVALVDDLIEETIKDSDVSSLLRKARVLANRLKIEDFEAWIVNELNGYMGQESVPEYRKVHGSFRFFNPFRGWCHISMPDDKTDKILSRRAVGQKIAEIESLYKSSDKDSVLTITIPPSLKDRIAGAELADYEIAFFVGRASLYGIMDAVKNTLQDWVLKLKDRGINSEGIVFTDAEQKAAREVTTTTINNIFHAPVNNAAIQQASNNSQQSVTFNDHQIDKIKELVDSLVKDVEGENIDGSVSLELKETLDILNVTLKSIKPNSGVISESLKTIRHILEGMAASKLVEYIPVIRALLPS
jgi:hypothetical protein